MNERGADRAFFFKRLTKRMLVKIKRGLLLSMCEINTKMEIRV